jgi:hypothetical protein
LGRESRRIASALDYLEVFGRGLMNRTRRRWKASSPGVRRLVVTAAVVVVTAVGATMVWWLQKG